MAKRFIDTSLFNKRWFHRGASRESSDTLISLTLKERLKMARLKGLFVKSP